MIDSYKVNPTRKKKKNPIKTMGPFWDHKNFFVQHKEFPFVIRKIFKH